MDTNLLRRAPSLVLAALAGAALAPRAVEHEVLDVSGFAVEHEVVVPGTPIEVFDAFTGDVSGWWDHHYSEDPVELVIEPRPGGRFYETFDEEGNGAVHANVTHVRRGEELVFRGPLGFGSLGVHFDMVHRVTFTPEEAPEDGSGSGVPRTRVRLTCRGVGEVQEGWAEAVARVWVHFLDERFAPYVGEGRHRR